MLKAAHFSTVSYSLVKITSDTGIKLITSPYHCLCLAQGRFIMFSEDMKPGKTFWKDDVFDISERPDGPFYHEPGDITLPADGPFYNLPGYLDNFKVRNAPCDNQAGISALQVLYKVCCLSVMQNCYASYDLTFAQLLHSTAAICMGAVLGKQCQA